MKNSTKKQTAIAVEPSALIPTKIQSTTELARKPDTILPSFKFLENLEKLQISALTFKQFFIANNSVENKYNHHITTRAKIDWRRRPKQMFLLTIL